MRSIAFTLLILTSATSAALADEPGPPKAPSIYDVIISEETNRASASRELADTHNQIALFAQQISKLTAENADLQKQIADMKAAEAKSKDAKKSEK